MADGMSGYEEIIAACKAQYGHVYMTRFADASFVWRPLTSFEYRSIFSGEQPDAFKEEVVCYLCVVWPRGYDFSRGLAGYPSVLAAQILEKSYYDTPEHATALLQKYRAEMAHFDCQMDCYIAEAFPRLDIESIQNMTMERRLWLYSRAEWTLMNLRGMKPQAAAQGSFAGVPVSPPEASGGVDCVYRDENYKGDDPSWIYLDEEELDNLEDFGSPAPDG